MKIDFWNLKKNFTLNMALKIKFDKIKQIVT